MKTLISLCCEDIIRDAESNSISIHNIIEEINGEGFPMLIPKFCIFLFIEKQSGDNDNTEANLFIKLNSNLLHSFPMAINFQGKSKTRNNIKIGGLPITELGVLTIEITHQSTVLANIEIPVNSRVPFTYKVE
jgi:hypothetical protein